MNDNLHAVISGNKPVNWIGSILSIKYNVGIRHEVLGASLCPS